MTTTGDALARAKAQHQAGRLAAAEASYRQVLATAPTTEAVVLLGTLLMQAGRIADATAVFRDDVRRKPRDAAAHVALASLLQAQGAVDEAAGTFHRAAMLAPAHVPAWLGLAQAARATGRWHLAIDALQRAAVLAPQVADVQHALGRTLLDASRPADAIAPLVAATALDARRPDAPYHLGLAHAALGRFAAAADAYRQAIARKPDFPEAYNNLGGVEKTRMRLDEAEAAWRASLRHRPDAAGVIGNLAGLAEWQARHDDAVALHRRAIALAPADPALHGNLLFTLQFHPRVDAEALRAEHDAWAARHARRLAVTAPHRNERDPTRRLRVGYVSSDFRDHVLGRYLLPLLKAHDREVVDVVCYANQRTADATTAVFQDLASTWRDIAGASDDDVAARVRHDAIDVLVDTTLHMGGNRLLVFARKPAPVQVTFAGYPGSTGLAAIDWRLSDVHLDPPGTDRRYVERTWRLPATFWCYDPGGVDVPIARPPAETNGYVTFGCLNNFAKLNDDVLALWARVLAGVPGARLLLLAPHGGHRTRTIAQLEALGVAGDRVAFADHAPRAEYLALYDRIDIALDTVPYNGHTTSLDALWMGVPVVTLVGPTVVGLAGLSQLTNLGLAELVAGTPAAYVDIALALAGDAPRRAALRRTLRARMAASPLMDAPAFARAIEAAYRAMWTRWCASPG